MRGNPGKNVAGLLVLTSAFGAVFLSRNSLGYVSPYLDSDLHLTGQQLGLLAAAFSIAWAASGFAAGKLKSILQERRALVALFIALGCSTVLTATASTFLVFFVGRLLAGASGGPVLPLVQSYTSQMGSTSRRGLRMGIVQGVGSSLIGSILAPLILIPLAEHWHWESSFLLVAIVAFAGAALLLRFLPATPMQAAASDATSSPRLASQPQMPRNVIVCCAISAAMVCWLIVSLTFYPSYLLRVGYTPTEMSGLMSVMGAGGLIGAILVPFLSDRFGRRQLMIASTVIGTFSPTALLLPQSSFMVTFIALFLGSLAGGSLPLFLAIIPSESVEAAELPAAIGRVQGVGEIAGGVAAPVIAGMSADSLSAAAPVAIVLASAIVAVLLSFGLKSSRESCPSR